MTTIAARYQTVNDAKKLVVWLVSSDRSCANSDVSRARTHAALIPDSLESHHELVLIDQSQLRQRQQKVHNPNFVLPDGFRAQVTFKSKQAQSVASALTGRVDDAILSHLFSSTAMAHSNRRLADIVLDWNEIALAQVTKAQQSAPVAARTMAMVHLAMFDAINAFERAYTPYAFDGTVSAGASPESAAASAAHAVLSELLPTAQQQEPIDDGALDVRLPKHARKELKAFLDCGLLCRGFARLYCPACEHSQLVAFSCKGRGYAE